MTSVESASTSIDPSNDKIDLLFILCKTNMMLFITFYHFPQSNRTVLRVKWIYKRNSVLLIRAIHNFHTHNNLKIHMKIDLPLKK